MEIRHRVKRNERIRNLAEWEQQSLANLVSITRQFHSLIEIIDNQEAEIERLYGVVDRLRDEQRLSREE